jgi:hypothetical protein
VLKNSQIEQTRKSRPGAHNVVYAGGRHGKPYGSVTGGKASQSAEPLVRSNPVSERIGLAQSWIERLSLDSAVHVLTSAARVIISPQDLNDGAKDKLPWPRGERAGDHLGIKSP